MTDEITAAWDTLKSNLQTLAGATRNEKTRNLCLSAIENAQTYRDCGRMTDGVNLMSETWDSIK